MAVCGDTPSRCDRLRLSRTDILIHEVDLRKLGAAVATALGLETAHRPEPTPHDTWNLGAVAIDGDHATVHLALPPSSDDFRRTVTELVGSTTGPFVLLTPLSHRADAGAVELIRRQRGRYFVLDELLTVGRQGELTTSAGLPDLLTPGHVETRPADNCFRRSGQIWEIAFRGKRTQLKDAKGLRCLQVLLQNPGRDYHLLELEQAIGQAPPPAPGPRPDGDLGEPGDLGPIIDDRTRAEVRERLHTIDSDLAEAEANRDLGTADRLRDQKEQLERYLAAALGLGGRPRRSGDPVKQARDRVTQAITRSRKAIEREIPLLDEHLTGTLHQGAQWSYRPEQPMDWQF